MVMLLEQLKRLKKNIQKNTDGSRIADLRRTTETSTKVLNFVYDEAQMLVGFTYNGNEYFYDRLVNGEIRYIIDKTGHEYVSYEYEEIICTPNHSILTLEGWKEAKELTNKDLVKTSTGYVKVLSIKLGKLEEKQSVYNFNVLGYHTYVVGNNLLIVHNKCANADGTGNVKQKSIDSSRNSAFRHAKRDAGIPMNQQPTKVVQSINRKGILIQGRTYIFNNQIIKLLK